MAYAISKSEVEEEDFAAQLQTYKDEAKKLSDAIDTFLATISDLSDTKVWPAMGWDYADVVGTVQDFRPNMTPAYMEELVTDAIEEGKLG